MLDVLTLERIREAATVIRGPSVIRTPLLPHLTPSGRRLWLKCENFQSIGAFKIRGATHMIRKLPSGTTGVVAHSSGNHAQAVARAAKDAGLPAVVVMPSDAPPLKRARTEADGAEIVEVGPDSDERAQRADLEVKRRGWTLVPPFDHPDVAAGQGTAGLEALEDLGEDRPRRFYCPTSGGGLLAGCATAFHALAPDCEIVAVEPDTADDTAQSLARGERVAVPPPPTVADGLRVRIPGKQTFEVLKARVHRARLVTDEQILDAMAYGLRRLRMVIEPGGAASLAAALAEGADDAVVLLSGGNVEPSLVGEVLRRPEGRWG
ncbi:MAG: threonine/serine dehydratase [Myxococcota bacterium]